MDFYCTNFGIIILIFIIFFLGKTDFIFESSTLSQKSYLIRARYLKSNKRLTFYWFYMNNNQSSFLNAVNILIVALIDLNGINYFWTNFRHTQRYNSFCTIFKIFMVFLLAYILKFNRSTSIELNSWISFNFYHANIKILCFFLIILAILFPDMRIYMHSFDLLSNWNKLK